MPTAKNIILFGASLGGESYIQHHPELNIIAIADKKQARKLIKDHCKKLETYKQPAKINFVAATQHSERFKKQRQTSE